MEIGFITNDIDYTLDNLEDWMAPRHKPRGLANIGHKVGTHIVHSIVYTYIVHRFIQCQNHMELC